MKRIFLNSALFLGIVTLLVSCKKEPIKDPVEPPFNEYSVAFEGESHYIYALYGDTTINERTRDTITLLVRQDSLIFSGTYNHKFLNVGSDISASESRYISAAGGSWGTGFSRQKDSIFVTEQVGRSFRSVYNFKGKAL